MNQDFKDINEVLKHKEEVLVLDLLAEVLSVEEIPYISSLKDPEEGIYLLGAIEPLLRKSDEYYYYSKLSVMPNGVIDYANSTRVVNLNDIFKAKDDIVDRKGNIVMRRKDLITKAKYMKASPTVPAMAIKMAMVIVHNYLNGLCRHTQARSISYNMRSLVREDKLDLIYGEEYELAFQFLIDKIHDFVGKDSWHLYHYYLRGTTLVIEKGVDYRIYKYYEDMFATDD